MTFPTGTAQEAMERVERFVKQLRESHRNHSSGTIYARDMESLANALDVVLTSRRALEHPGPTDGERMDWLEKHTVNVRVPCVHGSRDLFWASPDDSFEGEEGPSDLRALIDAEIAKTEGVG